jgi:hypothetical protein
LIFIHMAVMQGSGQELAKRIGMAWDHRKGATKWGVLPTPVTLTDAAKESPIFERFPAKFDLAEEFYWHLRGDPAGVTTLMTAPAGPAIANKPLSFSSTVPCPFLGSGCWQQRTYDDFLPSRVRTVVPTMCQAMQSGLDFFGYDSL